jgi:UBA-like domain
MARTKINFLQRHVEELADALGIDPSHARDLLEETQGDMEEAAARFLAQEGISRAGPSNHQSSDNSRAAQLQNAVQEMGLPSITRQQATKLLRDGGNSVERALELYLENPSSAGPRGPTAAAAGAQAAANNDEPIIIVSSSDEEVDDEDDEDDSDAESDQEGIQDVDGGGNASTGAAHVTSPYASPYGLIAPAMPSTSDSSSSDSDDNGSGSSGSDDSDSDGSGVQFESEEEVWAAAAAAYDEYFQQQGTCYN